MKKVILVLILIGGLGAGTYYWRSGDSSKKDDAPTLGKIARGPIKQIVASTGKVVSNLDVDIKCKASGEVIKLPYDVSDLVTKGSLVLELDPIDEQRAVAQREAALSSAKGRLLKARQTLQMNEETLATDRRRLAAEVRSTEANARDLRLKAGRAQQLLEKKLCSQEEYGSAETAAVRADETLEQARVAIEALKARETARELDRTEVQLAETAVQTAEIDLAEAQQRLKDTKIVAPIDGVVTTRPAQIGTIVSSGITNIGGGTSIMTLSDLSRLFVLAPVDEADIGRVRMDQKVVIKCDAYPNTNFSGKILRIAAKGSNSLAVVTFEVKIEILGEDKSLLKPEMTTDVEIVLAEREGVIRVPSEAVLTREAKDQASTTAAAPTTAPATNVAATMSHAAPSNATPKKRYVLLPREKELKDNPLEREVEVGLDDGTFCEILSGIQEHDKVIIRGVTEGKWGKAKKEDHGDE